MQGNSYYSTFASLLMVPIMFFYAQITTDLFRTMLQEVYPRGCQSKTDSSRNSGPHNFLTMRFVVKTIVLQLFQISFRAGAKYDSTLDSAISFNTVSLWETNDLLHWRS